MSQPAEIQRVAPVISIDAWRAEHLADAERSVLARRRAEGPREIVHGWHDLAWIGQTDARDAIRIYERRWLHPIAVHGITPQGGCTCGRADCPSPGKHPVYRGWQTAPLDLDRLDRDLIDHPRWSVGLRTGTQRDGSVLVAIDVDGPRELLAPLEAELGPLPATLTQRTGSGGLHLIYRMPAGRPPPRNRVRLAPGVDVRSQGGQILAAPSRHASGGTYRWIDARAPEVLP